LFLAMCVSNQVQDMITFLLGYLIFILFQKYILIYESNMHRTASVV
jgi:hypothetical protein